MASSNSYTYKICDYLNTKWLQVREFFHCVVYIEMAIFTRLSHFSGSSRKPYFLQCGTPLLEYKSHYGIEELPDVQDPDTTIWVKRKSWNYIDCLFNFCGLLVGPNTRLKIKEALYIRIPTISGSSILDTSIEKKLVSYTVLGLEQD